MVLLFTISCCGGRVVGLLWCGWVDHEAVCVVQGVCVKMFVLGTLLGPEGTPCGVVFVPRLAGVV